MSELSPISYINALSEVEFEGMFFEMAHSNAFSSIASRVSDPVAIKELHIYCEKLKLPSYYYQDDEHVKALVCAVAARFVSKL